MNYPMKKRAFFSRGKDEQSSNSSSEALTIPKSSPAPWDSEPPALIPLSSLDSPCRLNDVHSNKAMSTDNFPSCCQFQPNSAHYQHTNSPKNSTKSTYWSSRSCCESKPTQSHCDCPSSSSSFSSDFYDNSYGATADCLGFPIGAIVEDLVDILKEAMHHEEDKNFIFEKETESKSRLQKCSFCLNHGIEVLKKGHKWECPFVDCECQRCVIIKRRQKTMRAQQKLTRELQLQKRF